MAIPHATSGELIPVLPPEDSLSAMFSTAIVKADQLEVMRVVLPAGKGLPEHRVAGEITVQCTKGSIHFTAHGRTQLMQSGDMLFLAAHEPHALLAQEDAAAIVTICLVPNATNGASAP